MSANQLTLWYLVASVCFILALKGLSHPETARRGNWFGIAGMTIAVITTIAVVARGRIDLILIAMLAGGTIDWGAEIVGYGKVKTGWNAIYFEPRYATRKPDGGWGESPASYEEPRLAAARDSDPVVKRAFDIAVALAPNGRHVALARVDITSPDAERFSSNLWLLDLSRSVVSRARGRPRRRSRATCGGCPPSTSRPSALPGSPGRRVPSPR